ncbi:MAG: DUF2723 domain-containing protein, partial [Bacteroidales bacterium]|nr:DUF2723 domain-containing protein [Bacteroidales bacterium]
MKRYNLINNSLGWLMFVVAAVTYLLTLEPTASFWDCGEFISQGYKLEVGHPPGNPIFMLAARFFVNFASGPETVAICVNAMSALLSAGTILLLFWTITQLVRRLIVDDGAEEVDLRQMLIIMGSGVVGALAYTWSDTFWFSAVEGEVYAFSSFCTALTFWLILKWEARADNPSSDRYLIAIAYTIGVSIAVHLLNLLCIPAIVLVIYYRKFKNTNAKGSLIALAVSFVIVALILFGLVPGFVEIAQYSELLFVNDFGLSFNSGVLIYALVLGAVFAWAIYEFHTGKSQVRMKLSFFLAIIGSGMPFIGDGFWIAIAFTLVLAVYLISVCKVVPQRIFYNIVVSIAVIFFGYSSYALILIRSNAQTPMDQNSPDNVFALADYLNREQYGKTPLIYGPAYTAGIVYQLNDDGTQQPVKTYGKPQYRKQVKSSPDEPDRYKMIGYTWDYQMTPEMNMLFPRLYAGGASKNYNDWMGGIDTKSVLATNYVDQNGNPIPEYQEMKTMPTFAENLRYFFSYQLNYMYWRYFMWNFAGRQNDIQGQGEITHGNWITGIPVIDNARLGDQSLLPDDYGKGNAGHNVFYMLPLILGIIGLLWQAYCGKRGIEQFWVVFFLFFMTGIAIVIYLNQTPTQPRERDYAYAGSFYAFSIWCGMGVAAIINMVNRYLTKKESVAVAAVIGAVALLVPVQMASQTWDDHDRSGRYTCRDFGQNYLTSMQKGTNPVIFTNGDNDTFPLWYNQDVEGVGTDARVCNLSYLQTDWYIDQMVRPAYDSPALPITWKRIDYCSGKNEYITVNPELKSQILEYYAQNPDAARQQYGDDPFNLTNIMKYWVRGGKDEMHVIPTDTVYVTIDKNAVLKSGMKIPAGMEIPEKMAVSLKGKNALYKNDLMMLEMINNANWTRPLYVATTVGAENFMNLGENFIQEGLVNRITPFATNDSTNFDTDRTYDVVMNRFKFGGLETKGLYID